MRTPYDVFSEGDWLFLTAAKLEGQWFERKAHDPAYPPHGLHKFVRDKLCAAICGFANSNHTIGGLFVLGISNDGEPVGIDRFGEDYLNEILSFRDLLDGPSPEHKLVQCTRRDGVRDRLVLVFTPYLDNRLARTTDGKSYERYGDDTKEIDADRQQELRYAKRELSFEDEPAIPLDGTEFDEGVASELTLRFAEKRRTGTEPTLRDALRLMRLSAEHNGRTELTNAGLLLIARTPRTVIQGAYVRFLRYDGTEQTSTVIRDETFEGPIPTLIQRLRDFLPTQFARFSFRTSEGGLTSEDEYPAVAWDEAVVNALVHRSYSHRTRPIFIRQYTDRLEVTSPGKYPPGVSPTNLVHSPRNTNLMEGLRLFDFVRMAEEGTKAMAAAMISAGLPAPQYSPPQYDHVTVILYNNFDERVRRREQGTVGSGLTANIFSLKLIGPPTEAGAPFGEIDLPSYKQVRAALIERLKASGLQLDSFTGLRAVDFRDEHSVPALRKSRLAAIYAGFEFRLFEHRKSFYLVLDHVAVLRSRATLDRVIAALPWLHIEGKKAFVRKDDRWLAGRIAFQQGTCFIVELIDEEQTQLTAAASEIVPELSTTEVAALLNKNDVHVDLVREIRRASLVTDDDAAARRFERIGQIAARLSEDVFPLHIDGWNIELARNPLKANGDLIRAGAQLTEPRVQFDQKGLQQDDEIVHGLTTYGSFDKPNTSIPLVLLAPSAWIGRLQQFVDRLRTGENRFKGVESTFSITFGPMTTLIAEPLHYETTITRFVDQAGPTPPTRPVFIVFAPERGISHADYTSPYFSAKRLLVQHGYPSQMVSEDTLENPQWKDLNFALDIFAKAGFTPWVLAEGLPGADVFVGLSSSVLVQHGRRSRVIGYANVFDRFGKWLFYEGASTSVPFENRNAMFADLAQRIIRQYTAGHRRAQWVHIHHDAKLRRIDRDEIARGVFAEASGAEVSFVHINEHTPYRLFDFSPRSRGAAARGAWATLSSNRFIIGTTGPNPARQKFIGTPRPLEVTVHRIGEHGRLDLRVYAQHVLSLTRLNWASTRAFASTPITTKFAGDIAYLMNVFSSTGATVSVHEALVRTPWFL